LAKYSILHAVRKSHHKMRFFYLYR
jgi:hypothetical protein